MIPLVLVLSLVAGGRWCYVDTTSEPRKHCVENEIVRCDLETKTCTVISSSPDDWRVVPPPPKKKPSKEEPQGSK